MTYTVVNVNVNIYTIVDVPALAGGLRRQWVEATPSNVGGGERVSFGRLLWVGPLAIVAALFGLALFGLVELLPLTPGSAVLFTVLEVLGAVVVFALVARFSRRTILLFGRVAPAALLVTLVPDVVLLVVPSIPGTTVPGALTLMAEHIAAWAVSVGVLTALAGRDMSRRYEERVSVRGSR